MEAARGSFVYWLPAIQGERCGFLGGNQFVEIADLP
jgi:hypothetical protein